MKRPLPPGVSARRFEKTLREFASVVGSEWVLSRDEDITSYTDPYAMTDEEACVPSAAVAPQSVTEIQAILKIANRHRVPLWPVSRGKNLGYGGAAPVLSGTVILDLGRMKRILEVNEKLAYCVVEPGVGFFDLFEHLQARKIPLWLSVPGNSWGSVMGNALEHGIGQSSYGDHAAQVCGMEVLLADGTLIRTGMGSMVGNSCWHLFKYGFGPSWEPMFMQSNFGIVTKMGLWLMPAAESVLLMSMALPKEDDLGWAIDVLQSLRMQGILQSNPSLANPIRQVTSYSQRIEWYKERGPIPNTVLQKIVEKLKTGWWTFQLSLFGHAEVNRVHARLIREAFAAHTESAFTHTDWNQGDPIEHVGIVTPGTVQLHNVNWWGGRGGHVDFSPISPPIGVHAMKQYLMTRGLFEEHGFDYSGGFTLGARHLNHISMILYDRDDTSMTGRARQLFARLVQEAAQHGYGEYRSHVRFMNDVARSYDFNRHALLRLNERVKDVLDPNGVLAPGKQGIWPSVLRSKAAE